MSEGAGLDLVRLGGVTARIAPHAWAWAETNAEAIAGNWAGRRARTPGLFDGPVLLSQGHVVEGGVCALRFFETRYARFLALHDLVPTDAGIANAFAAIVPHTADGAVLLGEMAQHTANAGQVYFPCGTPDRDDVRADGRVDLAASAAREFHEETGIALPPMPEAGPWLMVRRPPLLALFRPVRLAEPADALLARFATHRAAEAQPELVRLVVVRGRADIDPRRMPDYVRAYLEEAFPA